MNIRRFFAPDMRRAIQLVRKEHGPDAVILSSRTIDGGMEIVSALDYDEALLTMLHSTVQEEPAEPAVADGDDAAEPAAAAAESEASAAVPAWSRKGVEGDEEAATAGHDTSATSRLRKRWLGRSAGSRGEVSQPPSTGLPARPVSDRAARVSNTATNAVSARGVSPSATRSPRAQPPMKPREGRSSTKAATAHVVRSTGPARGHSPTQNSATPSLTTPVAASSVAQPMRKTTNSPPDRAVVAIRKEFDAMKYMLSEQLAQLGWADTQRLDPDRALLVGRVAQLGLTPELVESLVAEIREPANDDAWREVMLGLARRLRVPKNDPLDEGGVFALVGPTGVGKTTTIAKLAARHCVRHGRESLALISTDTLRVGAHRQLDAYGAILGVPVRLASDAEELGRLLYILRDRRLVLVDTAGMAARDRRLGQALSQLDVGRPISRYIVLAANMQERVMNEAVRCFGGKSLAGAVLTKLDETDGLGPVLSVLIEQRLKAVWLSHGQQVPEDLRLASGLHLLRWAFPQPEPKPASRPRTPYRAPAGLAIKEGVHAGA